MDRKIEKAARPGWQWAAMLGVVLIIAWLGYRAIADASIRTYRTPAAQLMISTVQSGAFEDVTPVRGTIQPLNSVFLDAVEGGVVEQIFVREGAWVEAGQPLLQLSNTSLRLDVARNDTSITEQLNNLATISNQLETTKLTTERQLLDIEYRITVLERQRTRLEEMTNSRLTAQSEYDAVLDDLDYQQKLLANTRARQDLENKIREERLVQIAAQVEKLEENLKLAQISFENLLVRAPISGQLTSLPVEVGESKTRGQRLGQIDVVDQYKITAQVDEFYVSRVAPGQQARFTIAGQQHTASITKVYPEISAGTFMVDMEFDAAPPANIRRGQTLQMELTLGNPVTTLLLPLGGFVQDTGGNWAFVLDSGGEYAVRRDIRAGRRNNRFIEVREGLAEGDRVITSSYGQMVNMERIQLTQ